MADSKDSTVVTTVPLTSSEQIKSRIADLLEALQKGLPGYESILHIIHRNLATDPDTVHLLTDEEVGVICSALQKKTGTFIAKESAEKMVKSKKKITVDDL